MSTPSPLILREPIKVVADILQQELALDAFACVLQNEKNDIPPNYRGLFVSLLYLGPGQLVGSNNFFDPVRVVEVQQATVLHVVQIDLLSYDGSARARHPEVALALASVYAQQKMEQFQLGLARMPGPFVDASMLEVTKRLNRFTTTISVGALYEKVRAVPYYDEFAGQLTTDPPGLTLDVPVAPIP